MAAIVKPSSPLNYEKYEVTQSIFSPSVTSFPKTPKYKNESGLPWGVMVSPFVDLNDIESTTNSSSYRQYKSNADYCKYRPLQCPNCNGFLNTYCKVQSHQWHCSICFTWTSIDNGQALYRHPQIKDDFVDYVVSDENHGAKQVQNRIIHAAVVDVTLPEESLDVSKQILIKSINEIPDGMYFSLLTLSYSRIGLFDLRGKNMPKIIFTTICQISETNKTYIAPNVPLYELVNGFEYLSICINKETRLKLKSAIKSIRSENKMNYLNSMMSYDNNNNGEKKRGKFNQMQFAFNGLIYSINESFSTTAQSDYISNDNENNDMIKIKTNTQQQHENANIISGNTSSRKRSNYNVNNNDNNNNNNNSFDDIITIEGVSVNIFTGNNHSPLNNSVANNGDKQNNMVPTWYAGNNTLKDEIFHLVDRGISYSFVIVDNDQKESISFHFAPLIEWTGGSIIQFDAYDVNIGNKNKKNIDSHETSTIFDSVVNELFLKDFAYSSRLSLITTPKFKIQNSESLYPMGSFHRINGSNMGYNYNDDETEYYDRGIIIDHMKQWVNGRCHRSTSFPINFEFVDSNGFQEKWSANPAVQVVFEYTMFNRKSSKVEKHLRVFTERFEVAKDLLDLYSNTNVNNTFSMMAHKITIERSIHVDNKDDLKDLLMDFLIYLITQFTKRISQNVHNSIAKLDDARRSSFNKGSLEPLIRLFYGLSQLTFFEKAASIENLLMFRIYYSNADLEQWVNSVYPAPEISLQNDQSYQLYLNRYDEWLKLLERETKEYIESV